jgi:hypothetical protein
MDKVLCKYHPLVPACWFCEPCQINLCSACIKQEERRLEPGCPVCRSPLGWLGFSNVITPFWQRIPRFCSYPINVATLVYLAALSGVAVLLAGIPLLGLLMQFVIWALFLRYAYEALEQTAAGHLETPALSFDLINDGLELPFKQYLIFVVTGALLALVFAYFGGLIGIPLLVLLTLALPASVMVLAIRQSLVQALNPAMLWSVIRTIGWPYLTLSVLLLTLWGAGEVMDGLVAGRVPEIAYRLIINFFGMYSLLVMFAMVGYVIHQYHEALGYSTNVTFDDPDGPGVGQIGQQVNPVLAGVAILIEDGKLAEAQARLREAVMRDRGSLALHGEYHKLLKLSNNVAQLSEHGREYVSVLLGRGKPLPAAEVVRTCRQADAEFKPTLPEQIYPLASQLRALREPRLALSLANGFHKLNPGHPDIPRLYLLVAQIMCEDVKQSGPAREVLKYLLGIYPDHLLHKEISDYLALVEQLPS